jgi:hypothetical protein
VTEASREVKGRAKLGIHLYPSPLSLESRIFRITNAIIRSGLVDTIEVQGSKKRHSTPPMDFAQGVSVAFVMAESRLLQLLLLNLRVIRTARKVQPKYIAAHTATTLPGAAAAALLSSSQLLYLPHELESKSVGAGKFGWVYRASEILFARRAVLVVTVNEYIKKWYSQKLRKTPIISIRNIPEPEGASSDLPDYLLNYFAQRNPNRLLFLYQGNIVRGRGIEKTLEAAVLCSQHDFLFVGHGDLLNDYKIPSNVTVFPPVKPSQLAKVTNQASVGLTLIEPICESYKYSLPNKFWQYLSASIPQIMTAIPEIEREGREYSAGWLVSEDLSDLATLINKIGSFDVEKMRSSLRTTAVPTWAAEEELFVKGVRSALK